MSGALEFAREEGRGEGVENTVQGLPTVPGKCCSQEVLMCFIMNCF